MKSHCPHGVYVHDDLCLDCFLCVTLDHLICQLCGMSGNLIWADYHAENCAGLKDEVPDESEIPF